MALPSNIGSLGSFTVAQLCAAMGSATLDELVALKRQIAKFGFAQPVATFGYPADSGTALVRAEWAALLRSGRTFGGVFGGTSAIGNFVQAQLWNPVGSGKRGLVYLGRGSRSVGIADQEIIYQLDTVQLAIAGNIASQIASAQNLIDGGAAPSFQVRGGNAAAFPTGLMFTRAITPTETPTPGGFLVELPEGFGFSMSGNTLNTVAFMTILWAEVLATYP